MNLSEKLFSLEGHTAIVAGGAGVIGAVISETLLKAGAHLIIWSTPPLGPSQPGRLQYTIGGPASQERSSASANP